MAQMAVPMFGVSRVVKTQELYENAHATIEHGFYEGMTHAFEILNVERDAKNPGASVGRFRTAVTRVAEARADALAIIEEVFKPDAPAAPSAETDKHA